MRVQRNRFSRELIRCSLLVKTSYKIGTAFFRKIFPAIPALPNTPNAMSLTHPTGPRPVSTNPITLELSMMALVGPLRTSSYSDNASATVP